MFWSSFLILKLVVARTFRHVGGFFSPLFRSSVLSLHLTLRHLRSFVPSFSLGLDPSSERKTGGDVQNYLFCIECDVKPQLSQCVQLTVQTPQPKNLNSPIDVQTHPRR